MPIGSPFNLFSPSLVLFLVLLKSKTDFFIFASTLYYVAFSLIFRSKALTDFK
jgi:hypothetical protein